MNIKKSIAKLYKIIIFVVSEIAKFSGHKYVYGLKKINIFQLRSRFTYLFRNIKQRGMKLGEKMFTVIFFFLQIKSVKQQYNRKRCTQFHNVRTYKRNGRITKDLIHQLKAHMANIECRKDAVRDEILATCSISSRTASFWR